MYLSCQDNRSLSTRTDHENRSTVMALRSFLGETANVPKSHRQRNIKNLGNKKQVVKEDAERLRRTKEKAAKAEAERLAKEKAAKAEAERLAKEKTAKEEEERLVKRGGGEARQGEGGKRGGRKA